MHKARSFFSICAGIFLLALAYHLGARSATAQASSSVEAVNLETYGSISYYTCVVGRTFYFTPSLPAIYTVALPVPGTSPIVATSIDQVYLTAILASGDVYQWDGSAWVLRVNLIGSPTPATQETWGELKAKYRGGAGAATQDK